MEEIIPPTTIEPPAPAMNVPETPTEESPLRYRWWLPLTVCLPMLFFVMLLLGDWLIVKNEMNSHEQQLFWTIIAIAAINFAGTGGLWGYLQKQQKMTGAAWAITLLLWQIAAVIVTIVLVQESVPNVEAFILPPDRWMYYGLTFYMPGMFYLLVFLSSLWQTKSLSLPIAMLGIIPAFFFLLIIGTAQIMRCDLSIFSFLFAAIAAIAIIFGALFYLCLMNIAIRTIRRVFASENGGQFAVVIVAWVLPFCGLFLNIFIPFPVDFLDWRVYVMTLVNGIVLLLPVCNNRFFDLGITFLKGVCYPFTLYFFLVFLPFLPLSIPAIIAFGGGFLILAPTLLFLVQNYRIFKDFEKLKQYLPKRLIITMFIGGLCFMPLWFIAESMLDKVQLEHAVKSCFHSQYMLPQQEQRQLSVARISRTLERLYSAKKGIEMPFLTPLYKKMVFSDLVLSDDKIKRIYFDLTGNKLKTDDRGFFFRDITSSSPLRMDTPTSRVSDRKSSVAVKLDTLAMTPLSNTGARLHLTVRNDGTTDGEYVTQITLPPGVMVNGFTLKIGNDIVPGRIFERKSAFWIYEKITSVRRDPALLSYNTPNQLRLLVFPVFANGKREVTIDLIYPSGTTPQIELDDRKLTLPECKGQTASWQLQTPAQLQQLPILKRHPELVFILDRSQEISHPQMLNRMTDLAARTDAASIRIVSGIIAAGELSPSFPVSDIPQALQWYNKNHAPGTPGFSALNIIKGAFLRYNALNSEQTFPVFVFISRQTPDRSWQFAHFAPLNPELNAMITRTPTGDWQYYDMESGASKPINGEAKKLALPVRKVCRLPDGQIVPQELGALCRGTGIESEDLYSQAIKLQADSRKLMLDPSQEAEVFYGLIQRSKTSGILIPQTAYIVLESEAQWKMLEQTEKKKLKKSSAFDIEEVRSDEPLLWLLLPILLIIGLFTTKRRKKTPYSLNHQRQQQKSRRAY